MVQLESSSPGLARVVPPSCFCLPVWAPFSQNHPKAWFNVGWRSLRLYDLGPRILAFLEVGNVLPPLQEVVKGKDLVATHSVLISLPSGLRDVPEAGSYPVSPPPLGEAPLATRTTCAKCLLISCIHCSGKVTIQLANGTLEQGSWCVSSYLP